MKPQGKRYPFVTVFLFALAISWIVFVWVFRFVPMEDYACWLCASRVFSQALQGHAVAGFSLAGWPIPNSAFVGLTGLLTLLMPSAIAGKLYLSLTIALYCAGAYFLLGSFTSRRDSALFMLPMLYVFHKGIWTGELSYSFGLGVFLLSAAYALRARRPSLLLIAVLSLLLFFCHAIPYICWAVLLCTLAIFDPTRFPRLKTAIAFSPSLGHFLLYVVHRNGQHTAHAGLNILGVFLQTPRRVASLFSPLHFFAPFFDSDPHWLKASALIFNACTLLCIFALVAFWFWKMYLHFRSERGTERAVEVAAMSMLLFCAVFPFEALTGVEDFNYRFLLPAFLLIVAAVLPVLTTGVIMRSVTASVVLVVLVFNFGYVARVSRLSAQVYDQMAQSNLNPDFRDITGNLFEPLAPSAVPRSKLLPVHDALYTFADYVRLERQWPGRIINTSFVQQTTTYPSLLQNTDSHTVWPKDIVLIGTKPLNRTVMQRLPSRYRVQSDSDYVLILKTSENAGNATTGAPAK